MEVLIIATVALGGAFLSFFSGFGLGTLLLPAFLLLFPPPVAIAATAVVHMLNNLFKLVLLGRYAQLKILISFGITSVIGAWFGAQWMTRLAATERSFGYTLGTREMEVPAISLVIGGLIIAFTLLEAWPRFERLVIPMHWFPVGGAISGFFGGVSGHQGALRSAFLMKAGLSKEAFMGNRAAIATLVDLTRIGVYTAMMGASWGEVNPWLVFIATMAAFSGAYLGNKFMKKIEIKSIHRIITVSLLVFGVAMCLGFI